MLSLIKGKERRSELMALSANHLALAGYTEPALSMSIASLKLKPQSWTEVHERAILSTVLSSKGHDAEDAYLQLVDDLPTEDGLPARIATNAAFGLAKKLGNAKADRMFDRAFNKTMEIRSEETKFAVLLRLASSRNQLMQQAEVRRPLDLALDAARRITDEDSRSRSLAEWARIAAEMCCLDSAKVVLEEAIGLKRSSYGGDGEQPYEKVSEMLTRSGRQDEVLTIANRCSSKGFCESAKSSLFFGMLNAGDTKRAIEFAHSSNVLKSEVFIRAIDRLASNGCKLGLNALWTEFSSGFGSTADIRPYLRGPSERYALRAVVKDLVACKEFDKAVSLGERFGSGFNPGMGGFEFTLRFALIEVVRGSGGKDVSTHFSAVSAKDRCVVEEVHIAEQIRQGQTTVPD